MNTLKVGTRVRLRRDVERYPHFIAPAGATGTVTTVEADMVGVTMDDPVDGCEEWENEVLWYEPDLVAEVTEDVEVLP